MDLRFFAILGLFAILEIAIVSSQAPTWSGYLSKAICRQQKAYAQTGQLQAAIKRPQNPDTNGKSFCIGRQGRSFRKQPCTQGCTGDGYFCVVDANCCRGSSCQSFVCAKRPRGCIPAGLFCVVSANCCSGRCSGAICS